MHAVDVGAGEACDLLIFSGFEHGKDQKIAAFGSSYGEGVLQGGCGWRRSWRSLRSFDFQRF
jgi:hypothetical protein